MRRNLQADTDPGWNRRAFLKVSAAATGGLLVSLYLNRPALAQEAAAAPPSKVYPPDAFVHIRPDGTIVIQVNRLEFGQGIHTALPMILADEMDADWSKVVAELAPADAVYADPVFGIQMVGQSSSVTDSFTQYRELGARTRAMLVAAAAARWKVPEGQCRTGSSVVHGPDGRSATYAELAEAAARIPVPEKIQLKSPGAFRLVGTKTRRLDSRPKCDGSLKFGLDLDMPGMKVAVVAHPPVFGARVKSFDDAAARAVEGVRDVIEIPLVRGTGVAVVADRFWPAKQGRNRLSIKWDLGAERPDSTQLFAAYRDLARTTGNIAVARGDANAVDLIVESRRIVAEYEFPFLAHTPMEPLNTTIRFDGDRAEVWAGSQFQTFDQLAIAEVLGLKPLQVEFHTEMAGGGFGRRAVPDSHIQREAAAIAKRLPRGVPVKLIWTREDDVQGGYYRPMQVHRVEAGVGSDGMPAAWRHVVVGQSLVAKTPFASMLIKNGVDATAVEGAADTHYAIPNFHLSAHHPVSSVPVLWFRSVGHTHTTFVIETLVDELATRAAMDPIAYRLKLLRPDARKVRSTLTLLQEAAGWRHSLPRGHAVGIACVECFGTAVACAADVSIEDGRPRIHRVTVALNCGLAVNPLTVESQFQGGVAFGVSQLMAKGAITLKEGRVEQRNFDGYNPPYMKDAPVAVDVHIVPSTEKPTGCGEPPVPVIAPAVVNALFRLTSKRYRTLPLAAL